MVHVADAFVGVYLLEPYAESGVDKMADNQVE